MEVTADTAHFLLGLVNSLTLNVGAPDFDTTLALVQNARRELQALDLKGVPEPDE